MNSTAGKMHQRTWSETSRIMAERDLITEDREDAFAFQFMRIRQEEASLRAMGENPSLESLRASKADKLLGKT